MIEPGRRPTSRRPSLESRSSGWVRARGTGILNLEIKLGASSRRASGSAGSPTRSAGGCGWSTPTGAGIVIGLTRAPLVNAGDALVHIASVEQ